MDDLRIIILALGVLIILGVMIDGLRRVKRTKKHSQNQSHKQSDSLKKAAKRKTPKVEKTPESIVPVAQAEVNVETTEISKATENETTQAAKEADMAETAQAAELRAEETPKHVPAEEKSWDEIVKESFKKRMTQAVEEKKEVKQAPVMPESVVIINVMAPRSMSFNGPQLMDVFNRQKLYFSHSGLFQYYNDQGEALFNVASAIEPGVFDMGYIQQLTTPGVTVILDLARVTDPQSAFNKMLGVVHEISNELGGQLLDVNYERLTQSHIGIYMAQIKGMISRAPAIA